jgi:sec-independent protein translocase protein TatC
MPFLDHLEELRWRLIKIIGSVIILSIIIFYFSDPIIQILLYPTKTLKVPINLQVLKIQAMFMVKMEVSIYSALILSIPITIYQIWAFLSPGLYDKEKGLFIPVIIFSLIAFSLGASFAFYVLIPFALDFFLSLAPAEISNNIALDFYFSFIIKLILVFGLVFQMPVISLVLSRYGLITPAFLRKHRSYAIVIIFIAAAILTPPDPITQTMLAVPLVVLYEVTILITHFFSRKRKREVETKNNGQ